MSEKPDWKKTQIKKLWTKELIEDLCFAFSNKKSRNLNEVEEWVRAQVKWTIENQTPEEMALNLPAPLL